MSLRDSHSRKEYVLKAMGAWFFYGLMIGIWAPLIHFFILRLAAGEPLPNELVNQLQFDGYIFAIAFTVLSTLFFGALAYWVYDPAKSKEGKIESEDE